MKVHTLREMEIFMQQHPELFDGAQAMWRNRQLFSTTIKEALSDIPEIKIDNTEEYAIFLDDAYRHQDRLVNGVSYANTYNNFYIFDVDKDGFPTPKYQIPINDSNRTLISHITSGKRISKADQAALERLGIFRLTYEQRINLLSNFPESSKGNISNDVLAERTDRRQGKNRKRVNIFSTDRKSNPDSKEYRRESARILREVGKIISNARRDGTFMKAPNGEASNLDPLQWVMVRTRNFKNWFGDWQNDPQNASKVLDENGEPLVVHHYTDNENLSEFSIEFDNYFSQTGGTKKAIFFTEDNVEPGSEDNFLTSCKRKLNVFLNIRDLETHHR